MTAEYIIGIDYGTDSVRSLLVDSRTGEELATSIFDYPRWKSGLYCDPSYNQFRQHPLDYIEGLEYTVRELLNKVPGACDLIRAISIDTTGSTPVAVNKYGVPLSLLPDFLEDSDAMFILWKDHTASSEADRITELCHRWEVDYSKFSGGIYSSEWFWAKIMHVMQKRNRVANTVFSWVEHCDWMPALLTGYSDPLKIKRSRGAAGHKALWHPEWGGLPSADFLEELCSGMGAFKNRLYTETYTSDVCAGVLCSEWSAKLGLYGSVAVGVGAMDSHFGFVGGQIEPYDFYKVVGTSTVDMIVVPANEINPNPISGICGQVEGSVLPGMMCIEAGQSGFGDIYAWFKDVLLWPLKDSALFLEEKVFLEDISKELIPRLSAAAEQVEVGSSGVFATDWMNGRRSPDANPYLKGALTGLSLGTDAPRIFRALVEATAFGSKKIMDRYKEAGIPMNEGITVMGGVARKSPFVMQVLCDVLDAPVKVVRSDNSCALGAAMFAAVVAGIYADISEAQKTMGAGFDIVYNPNPENVRAYRKMYNKYIKLGNFIEVVMICNK